ncbi:MAG: flagellar export chaperone FlgN [Clostridiaceae bacterium]|nr:flagellar export chaperone FlgN [Clostridiaceae bacterium]
MDSVNSGITELISLLDRKRQLFDKIMEMTLEQKKDIEENAAVSIEGLVNRKQAIIDKIDEIDRSFSERLNLLKKRLNVQALEEIDFTKYPELRNLKLKVEDIMAMAQKIMLIEKSNKEKLTAVMNNLKKDIRQMNVGKKSIRAYEKPVIYNDGIYIDKKK